MLIRRHKPNNLRSVMFAALAFASVSTNAATGWAPGEYDEYQRSCERAAKNGGDCAVTARRDSVPLYSEPSIESKVVGTFPFWMWMALDWRELGPAGWLRVKNLTDREQASDWAWVERKNVLNGNDYQPVIGCWPIKEVYSGLGDTTYQFRLDQKGSGRMYVDGKESSRVQIYMAGVEEVLPVVTWWGRGGMWARYDPARRQLIGDPVNNVVNGEQIVNMRLFSPEQLIGCGVIPKLQQRRKRIKPHG